MTTSPNSGPGSHRPRPHRPSWADLRHPYGFLALGFGSGLAPFAPGTFGTLAAIPLYLLLQPLPLWGYSLLLVVIIAIGIPICGHTAVRLGEEDHPAIVWDEVAGYLLTMLAAPQGWEWLVAGFVLFRFFDILKPWPIRAVERRLKGGLGIMLDDLLAALPAWLLLQGAAWLV